MLYPFRLLIVTFLVLSAACANAENFMINSAQLRMIRAVGNYTSPAYADTIELWFASTSVKEVVPACYGAHNRVYVSAKNKHLVSLAYMAFAMGKSINVNVDTSLPLRDGYCEVTFLDINS
jgi:hypothetical protein